MSYLRQRDNIKVCPGCGTNLINTARHCAVCGHVFTIEGNPVVEGSRSGRTKGAGRGPRLMPAALNLPVLLGVIILMLAFNLLVIVGFQNRDRSRALLIEQQMTATYYATIYVSPTPTATVTSTPAPPTLTPVVLLEYTVAPGDSCISIADRFDIYVDALLAKNDIDCANLSIGTVLRIPPVVPTVAPTGTSTPNRAP